MPSAEAACPHHGPTAASADQAWGVLRTAEGAGPSLVRGASRESLGTLATRRVGRRLRRERKVAAMVSSPRAAVDVLPWMDLAPLVPTAAAVLPLGGPASSLQSQRACGPHSSRSRLSSAACWGRSRLYLRVESVRPPASCAVWESASRWKAPLRAFLLCRGCIQLCLCALF